MPICPGGPIKPGNPWGEKKDMNIILGFTIMEDNRPTQGRGKKI